MKMFSDCSGECCVCGCGNFCLAGHGDDDFFPASEEEVLENLRTGNYPDHTETMVIYLKSHGVAGDAIEKALAERTLKNYDPT